MEQNQSLHYTERRVGSWQLAGDHKLDVGLADGRRLQLNWFGAYNFTKQDEPDVRFFRNTFNYDSLSGTMPSNSTDAQNTRRIFRNIEETDTQGSVDAALPFLQWTGTEGRIKAGLFLDKSDRTYTQRSFTYTFPNQFGSIFDPKVNQNRSYSSFTASRPGQLWTDVFLDPDRIGLAWNEPPAPNQLLWVITPLGDDVDYTGQQAINALYAMGEVPLTPHLRLTAGARYETTSLSVDPVNPVRGTVEIINVLPTGDREVVTVPQEEAASEISQADLLPALGATWEITAGMNLRASWSRTIARPTFRELAPVATEEFIFGDEFIGNPDLVLSRIVNSDLRWEWFPGPGDVLAVSAFYKKLTNPIELISFSAGGRTFVQPVNFEEGTVRGAEIEAHVSLDRLHPALRGLGVGANYTYINSEVAVPLSEQESLAAFALDEPTRRLQGQPAYLFNASVTYDNDPSGTSAGVFFGRVGETLETGAARGSDDGTPNTFNEPYDTLDVKVSQKLGKGFTLSLKGANLLKPVRLSVYRTPQGDELVHEERATGAVFGVSAAWSW